MIPLFAKHPGPNYQWTMTVGPLALAWQEWAMVLLVCSCAFTLLSVYLSFRYGRWWMTVPIAVLTVFIALQYGVCCESDAPASSFEDAKAVFLFALPFVIIHTVVSFTVPRRKQPFDDWPDSWEPSSRYNSP